MVNLNRKGFTLVELLAVIVVLAIIMIIAIPSITNTLSDAQRGTFKVFAEKSLTVAQGQYQADLMLGERKHSKAYGYCYTLSDLEMSTGNYKGYVIVELDDNLVPTFYVTLTDNNFSLTNMRYDQLDNLQKSDYDTPSSSITSTCPTTFGPQ